jgi:hypothetical protein
MVVVDGVGGEDGDKAYRDDDVELGADLQVAEAGHAALRVDIGTSIPARLLVARGRKVFYVTGRSLEPFKFKTASAMMPRPSLPDGARHFACRFYGTGE